MKVTLKLINRFLNRKTYNEIITNYTISFSLLV
jgi:hypothetical protein